MVQNELWSINTIKGDEQSFTRDLGLNTWRDGEYPTKARRRALVLNLSDLISDYAWLSTSAKRFTASVNSSGLALVKFRRSAAFASSAFG